MTWEPWVISSNQDSRALLHTMDEVIVSVTCPFCGEPGEIYVEPDVRGQFVQDCEVCCNPWLVRVTRDGRERVVEVSRGDGSD